jgi:CRP-like cAMP-binding protein
VLEEGSVLFWTRIGDSRKEIITFEGGHTLCSSALVESDGRLATAECLAPSRIWLLDIKAFSALRMRSHDSAFRLLMTGAQNLTTAYIGSLQWFRLKLGMLSTKDGAALPLPPGAPATEAHHALLKVVPFLRGWSGADLARLRSIATWRELKRGEPLFREGAPPGELHLAVRGALEASAHCTEGKMRFSLRGPGRWCGHEAFFSGQNQPFDVTVRENATLLSIERATFDALYAKRDPLALDLLEQVTDMISKQFNVDHRDMLKRMLERGHAEAAPVEVMRSEVGIPLKVS